MFDYLQLHWLALLSAAELILQLLLCLCDQPYLPILISAWKESQFLFCFDLFLYSFSGQFLQYRFEPLPILVLLYAAAIFLRGLHLLRFWSSLILMSCPWCLPACPPVNQLQEYQDLISDSSPVRCLRALWCLCFGPMLWSAQRLLHQLSSKPLRL